MGLARLKIGLSTMSNVAIVGTPYYSAPETFQGQVGKPSDVWSYGVVLVELFGGQRAWGDVKHQNELVGKIMKKELPVMVSHLVPQWRELCMLCLNYEPSKRKSMEEILRAVRHRYHTPTTIQ